MREGRLSVAAAVEVNENDENAERVDKMRLDEAHENDAGDDYIAALRRAADQFLVRRGEDLQSIIAGYHWFTDWGRDTMVSLTGLTLSTRQFHVARRILLAFAQYLSEGMISRNTTRLTARFGSSTRRANCCAAPRTSGS